jgi:hypothetical protein
MDVTILVETLVANAKRHGLRRVRAGDVEIEFWAPDRPAPVVEPKPEKPAGDPTFSADVCACGHHVVEHGAAGCWHGCGLEACVYTPKEQP